ncbi:WSC-domain-containing protein, partial [Cryphonectria parasitica EP155]
KDSAQTGYADNHNMDPTIISSGSFGQLWRYKTPAYTSGTGDEQFYAKPLVYTPPSYGRQIILAFSEQNRLFAVDAVNGTLIAFRDMNEEGEGPFNIADFDGDCNDISDTVGVTGTPILDPDTDTVYFWSKGYEAGVTSGVDNARYRFHAVDAITLEERAGFPTVLDGHQAANDETRFFQAGIQLQRPSLNLLNGVVYAGFGGHCDMFNYTGWIVGMRASDGGFVTAYATSAGAGAPPVPDTSGAGVWMAGSILASDQSNRFFFATGNGITSTINDAQAASGRTTLDTLSECVVNMLVNSDGTLAQQDYFEPAAYQAMDGADRDVGSGGVTLLTTPFSGGGVNNIAITCGKNGQCFVMNADNLGGYKTGASSGDNILQTITPPAGAAMFGTVASYPLEGGYIYMTLSGTPVYAYALGFDASGRPQFSYAGETATSTTGRPAVSAPMVTSLDGQEGTGILWIVDPDNGISAYNAVPQDGVLVPITLPASGQVSKFQRLVFGDGRFYTTAPGYIIAYGSPVTLPLNCTGPVNFGDVYIGSSAVDSVSCTALIGTTIESLAIGSVYYSLSSSDAFPLPLAAGQSFTLDVVFNLTGYSSTTGGGGNTTQLVPGSKSAVVTITMDNDVAEYASTQSISFTGDAITGDAYPAVNPLQVDFSAVVVTNSSSGPVSSGASDNAFVLSNLGEAGLEILRYAYTNTDPSDDDTTFTNLTTTTNNETVLDSNGYFSTTELPALGSSIAAGSALTVQVEFNTNIVGSYFTILCIWTNGGMVYVTLDASADSQPVAKVYYSDGEGGWSLIPNSPDTDEDWEYIVSFGTGPGDTDQTITLLVQNAGGSDLIVTKSKPPEGTYLGATNPEGDLAEGLEIAPGQNSTGTVYFEPPAAQINAPATTYAAAWTLNFNDLTWGVHVVNFTGTTEAAQVGPQLADGSARFRYLGCYLDSTVSRIESSGVVSANNSIGFCQDEAYAEKVAFAGVEYTDECYWGDSIPSSSLLATDANCEGYTCAGDASEYCGGDGGYISIWYDVTAYFPENGTLAPGYTGPTQPSTVGDYYFLGCYGDDAAARALSGSAPGLGSSTTLETCAAACEGYTYFGTEYSDECYCGDTINVESGTGVSGKNQTSGCTMVCAGNQEEYCGGSSRLSLYALDGTDTTTSSFSLSLTSSTKTKLTTSNAEITLPSKSLVSSAPPSIVSTASSLSSAPAGWSYVGCVNDSPTNRTLRGSSLVNSGMTVAMCTTYCANHQYPYAGLEYSTQCYCGPIFVPSSATTEETSCDMTCPGAASQICGGPSRLSIYQSTTQPPPVLVNSTSLKEGNTTQTFQGCFMDTQSNRTLSSYTFTSTKNMTVENCITGCGAKGFNVSGVEAGTECYCGSAMPPVSLGADTRDCEGIMCSGNTTEFCAGSSRLAIYM